MIYNIIDIDNNVITENVTEEQAVEFVESNSAETEFSYFFYPLDEEVLNDLKQRFEGTNTLRFIKRIESEA